VYILIALTSKENHVTNITLENKYNFLYPLRVCDIGLLLIIKLFVEHCPLYKVYYSLNGLKPTIKFITEQDTVQTLLFLDVLMNRSNTIIEISIYMKPMGSAYTTTPVTS
jgi:hypothetical protein